MVRRHVSLTVRGVADAYMLFGSPGRFFAATELKAMMAHVVLNYDIKFANEGVRPVNMVSSLTVAPNKEARVLFRKRHNVLA